MNPRWRLASRQWVLAIAAALLGLGVTPAAARALVDVLGHPVPPGTYRRIVSLAPSNTELLFAAGYGDRVVGVTDYCDYPPEAKRQPHLGGIENLAVEQVIALHPDLVLVVPSQAPAINQLARTLHAPVVRLSSETLASVGQNADALADCLGGGGHAFAERYRRTLAAIAPGRRHPRVFFLVWDRPLMTAGPTTFLHDLITRAGGRNVATTPGYAGFSEERLVAEPPDVVLYPDNFEGAAGQLRSRLPAARWISLPAQVISRPGARVLPLLQRVSRAFDR